MAIKLHDSLTRTSLELAPSRLDGVFRFYNCGPTVYAAAHIGNFRTFVVNDLLRRLLELEFPGKVKHVRNLTDVDDKTIRRSREEGRPLADVTRQWTEKFHADCAALNCLPPHEEPRAADPKYIREQVSMIEVLMEKGNAYRAADGSVYFKVSSFPGYGALSRVKERELQVGTALKAHAADADEKEDVSDFALWKAHKPEDGDVKWTGPHGAGDGRPGWHIECSAMSKAILGDTIDLHTGGVDLLFPHHENEIAQSQCCNGTTFARHWYHSEHLLVDGKKMSKSLGNLYTLDDLRAKGFSPAALRYALLAGHPRKQLNFTLDSLHAAESALKHLRAFRAQLAPAGTEDSFAPIFAALNDDLNTAGTFGALFTIVNKGTTNISAALRYALLAGHPRKQLNFTLDSLHAAESALKHLRAFRVQLAPSGTEDPFAPIFAALNDDLNTAGAFGALFTIVNKGATNISAAAFERVLFALGFDLTETVTPKADIPTDIADIAEKRWSVKQAKDFAAADALRKELTALGWSMLDRKDGYSLEPVKK